MENSESLAIREHVTLVGELGPLFEALSKAQGEFKPLSKDSEVEVRKEGKLLYTFKYCPLDVVIEATQPALVANGLSLMQFPSKRELVTVLAHKSGAYIRSACELDPARDAQAFGGLLTYFKRYARLSILGVFPAGEDDDANEAMGNQATVTQRAPAARATPPAVKPADPPKAADLPQATKDRIKALAASIGLKGPELNAFSTEKGCGALENLNVAKADALIKQLEMMQVQP